ncbi:hypothetical protein [uncultured Agathobaculum sp.]|uniref:hypothetical protein n=1 Tax=uncultured Agathobaculum sp. TaxID=2048140 RepID=UPI00320A499A
MNTKFETVFRTYSYRLYPTKMQQLELKALFDLQDHAFNDWADFANRGVAQGKSYETIQNEIESHEILTERREDRYALSVTRSHVLTRHAVSVTTRLSAFVFACLTASSARLPIRRLASASIIWLFHRSVRLPCAAIVRFLIMQSFVMLRF